MKAEIRNISRLTPWVKINLFCEATGYTMKAVTRKRQDGVWTEGVHWRKAPDGNIFINMPAYERWVENEQTNIRTIHGG